MNIFVFVIFGITIVPLLILAIFLLRGKGGFLIAGYNTMSKEDQAKYDERALCRFVGCLLIVTSFCIALIPLGIQLERLWLMYVGIALSIIIPIGAVIYMNTGDRFRKNMNPDSYGMNKNDSSDVLSEKRKSKNTKPVIIATSVFTILVIVIVGFLILYSAKEPVVNVTDQGIQIKSIYGISVNFTDLSDITLIEKSMNNIGVGNRTNGFGGMGDTLKGNFTSEKLGKTLLFVHANSSPTIRIEREGSRDIYISFRDSEATRALYEEMVKEFSHTD